MNRLPIPLEQELIANATAINGWLTPREMSFLSQAVINPTTDGDIVELGFYHGKSTSVLAAALKHMGDGRLTTVDPIDPELLNDNLQRLGLGDFVDVRQQSSSDFARDWNSPIRLLWHDGANDLETVTDDCQNLFRWLADRAIVAFHDVLNTSGERIHAFDQQVLQSSHFDYVGVCGSIGFGMFHKRPVESVEAARARRVLSRKLSRLKPFHSASRPNPQGIRHVVYRILRSRIPHGPASLFRAA